MHDYRRRDEVLVYAGMVLTILLAPITIPVALVREALRKLLRRD